MAAQQLGKMIRLWTISENKPPLLDTKEQVHFISHIFFINTPKFERYPFANSCIIQLRMFTVQRSLSFMLACKTHVKSIHCAVCLRMTYRKAISSDFIGGDGVTMSRGTSDVGHDMTTLGEIQTREFFNSDGHG